jgi:hypothetical protein
MGYVFIAFSDASRGIALDIRYRLEAARISTWLRDPQLDSEVDRELIYTALQAASVILVVWRKTSENTSYAVQLQRELSQARQLNIPMLTLTDEEEFEPIIEKLKAMVPQQSTGAPLPIPMVPTDLEGLTHFSADLKRPSTRRVATFLIAGIGAITFIGLFLVLQAPGGTLNPFTATPSQTVTSTVTATPSATQTQTATATLTPTLTLTPTTRSTNTATMTATSTLTPTRTASPTTRPRSTPSLSLTPINTLESEIIATKNAFPTNMPASTDHNQG